MFKQLLFSTLCVVLFQYSAQGQTLLFNENFNTGATTNFSLNTTDMSSTASGENPWIINNVYAGGSSTFMCFGYPIPFTVPAAPQQPAGITGGPTSHHLHITPQIAINAGGTVPAASYVAADGFCIFGGQNTFSRMTVDVNTVGQDSVEFDYWWACGGSSLYFGELYYSTNGGTTWTIVNNPATSNNKWLGQTTWTNTKLSDPAWAGQATLRFGFRFVTGTTTTGSELDPGYAVDDIKINGYMLNSIAAPTFSGTAYCPGDNLVVNYTANGTYTGGNTFTAQLSDATGSFAAPTAIGSVTATTSGTINATIPMAATAGSAYRIRVVSSTPSATSPDNGANITIAAGPTAGIAASNVDSICSGSSTGITLSGYSGSIIWESSANGTTWAGSSYTGDNFTTNNLSQDLYLRALVQNSCGSDTSNVIMVTVVPSPTANFSYVQSGSSLEISFTNNSLGSFSGLSWNFGDGNTSSANDPTHTYATDSSYIVTLTVNNTFGCSSVFTDTINVMPVAVKLVENISINNLQIFPNPNNGQFQITLDLSRGQDLQVYLIDLNGRRVGTLHNGYLTAGAHIIQTNEFENALSTGLYILELIGDHGFQGQKVSIVR